MKRNEFDILAKEVDIIFTKICSKYGVNEIKYYSNRLWARWQIRFVKGIGNLNERLIRLANSTNDNDLPLSRVLNNRAEKLVDECNKFGLRKEKEQLEKMLIDLFSKYYKEIL